MEVKRKKIRFVPSICVTHDCNLNCTYCYQRHDRTGKMTLDTAKACIDDIFHSVPDYAVDGVEVGFIGGEPLLEFELLKKVFSYTRSRYPDVETIFYATTNGTLLDSEMKAWFTAHRRDFVLGLSLDGARETHNANRSGSFDRIDIDFFRRNWPEQGVKMTLSAYSIPRLAENCRFVHSLGFRSIRGVNLAEGDFDWDDDQYIELLIPQLSELVRFYLDSGETLSNQMLDRRLAACETERAGRHKWCGIGTGCPFYDVDGKKYPCSFITPMTFSPEEIADILRTDFTNEDNFIDDSCRESCYMFPICPTCSGANYLKNKSFKTRDKSRCRIQKLVLLFAADLQARRIVRNPEALNPGALYHTIEAIKNIRALYLDEFQRFGL